MSSKRPAGPQDPPPSSPPSTDTSSSDNDSRSDIEATLQEKRGAQGGPGPRPVPKRPRREPSEDGSSSEENVLYQAVMDGRVAIEVAVDEWLQGYKRDWEPAFLELVNFIVRSCGCRGTVTLAMLREQQNTEIIQRLTETFSEDSSDYPLSLSTGPWRRFRASFGAVVTAVALRSRHAVLYDGFLLGGLTALLTSLADSQVRAFRHTATLAAMKLMTALVEVALGLSQRRDNTQRLYEAERGKSPPRRAPGKLEVLQETLRELQEQQEEIEAVMNAIFKGVFVHRYRDMVPDVRALCMEELGTWMCSFPASFLTDGHLKYLGWTLHDKQGEVRLRCVRALQGLYARRDTAAHMELFTGRFKARLVSMVQDKDPVVAVEVVKLLTVMLDTVAEALTEADCHRVYPAVFCSRRPLATAAGLFLYRSLLSPRHEGDTEPSPGSGDNRSFFRLLLTFFIESELHQHAAYLVDSLWDCAGTQLRDWDTAGGLLLEEAPEEALSDQQEKALVEILAASAKRAAGEGPPVGRGPPRKAPPKGRRAVTEQRSRLSLCLAPILPRLLAKPLEQALAQLQELVQKHTGPEVLGAASRALGALCDPRLPLRGRGELVRSRLGDLLGERCHRLLRLPSLDEEELYSATATLKRLSVLFNAHDLTPWQLFEPCTLLLRRAADTGEVPPQLLVPAITCAHFHILWELSRLANTDVPQEQLLSLKDKTTSFCALCQSCLSNGDAGVREQAFVVLSDLLLVLGPSGTRGAGAALAPLRLVPDVELRSQLAAVLLDHVFSPGDRDGDGEVPNASPTRPQGGPEPDAAEAHMEDLHRRRMLLAGFCKLIIYNVLEPSAASDVLKYYDKFHAEYGDIIKETLACIHRMDGQEWARVVLLSLQQVMTELLMEHGPGVRGVPAFGGLRDLGRRLSLFFGPRPQPNRQVLLRLHRDGIAFALQEGPEGGPGGHPGGAPLYLPFLEVLSEFSPRLLPPDRALLLTHLQQSCQQLGMTPPERSPWPPLAAYHRSLQPPEPPQKRRRTEETWQGPSPPLSPALTSTVLRVPPGPPWELRVPSPSSVVPSLSVMEEEEEEEEERGGGSSEEAPPQLDQVRDLFDSTVLGIED
ncbi:cohesin subunit SA-3-like isoform X3 [Anas platyrhynchos]|uniref:cohesin subunit SA-3-like isoform X3 n=1 Tax=Anas platyrhynchos TaxID=8839 RepID=UPI003AF24ECC